MERRGQEKRREKVVDLMMLATWCCKFFRVEYNTIQFSSVRFELVRTVGTLRNSRRTVRIGVRSGLFCSVTCSVKGRGKTV